MTNSVSTYANTHDQLQVEIWPEEKWNIITSKWDKTLWRLSVFDCPEIPENLVGALLHLKHNGAVTHGAVIFFSFIPEHSTCSSVGACSPTPFKPKIHLRHVAPGSSPDLDGFRWSAASSHISLPLLNNSESGSRPNYKSLLQSRTAL